MKAKSAQKKLKSKTKKAGGKVVKAAKNAQKLVAKGAKKAKAVAKKVAPKSKLKTKLSSAASKIATKVQPRGIKSMVAKAESTVKGAQKRIATITDELKNAEETIESTIQDHPAASAVLGTAMAIGGVVNMARGK